MVLDKLKYLIGPASGLYFHPIEQISDAYTHASAERGSVVREGDPDPQPRKKVEKLLGVTLRYSRCVC
jgi:hypothetical protein